MSHPTAQALTSLGCFHIRLPEAFPFNLFLGESPFQLHVAGVAKRHNSRYVNPLSPVVLAFLACHNCKLIMTPSKRIHLINQESVFSKGDEHASQTQARLH